MAGFESKVLGVLAKETTAFLQQKLFSSTAFLPEQRNCQGVLKHFYVISFEIHLRKLLSLIDNIKKG